MIYIIIIKKKILYIDLRINNIVDNKFHFLFIIKLYINNCYKNKILL
jgi:hypothetical protein